MLSSFVSQDFGYGHDLSASQLAIINNFRRGKTYVDEEAAIFVHGSKEKKKLTESPFVRWLHYGQNNDGYWNYHHMIVQLEDIVDVPKALYGQSYDFFFFFDHSSGHDHLRPDGLNGGNMNKGYGGAQAKMRNAEIKSETYLGPFNHPDRHNIGDVQSMQYKDGDVGPFYLSPNEKEAQRNDRPSGKTEKKKIDTFAADQKDK